MLCQAQQWFWSSIWHCLTVWSKSESPPCLHNKEPVTKKNTQRFSTQHLSDYMIILKVVIPVVNEEAMTVWCICWCEQTKVAECKVTPKSCTVIEIEKTFCCIPDSSRKLKPSKGILSKLSTGHTDWYTVNFSFLVTFDVRLKLRSISQAYTTVELKIDSVVVCVCLAIKWLTYISHTNTTQRNVCSH